jgi:hypothetical protein
MSSCYFIAPPGKQNQIMCAAQTNSRGLKGIYRMRLCSHNLTSSRGYSRCQILPGLNYIVLIFIKIELNVAEYLYKRIDKQTA